MRARVESSPDNDGTGRYCQTARVRQARREGATEVNQWQSPSIDEPAPTWRIWAGQQRTTTMGWSTPKPGESPGGEATPKACGVGVARLQGHSWAPPPSN